MCAHIRYPRKRGNCSGTPGLASALLGYRILHFPTLALCVTLNLSVFFAHSPCCIFTQNSHWWVIVLKQMSLNRHSEEKDTPLGTWLHVLQVI